MHLVLGGIEHFHAQDLGAFAAGDKVEFDPLPRVEVIDPLG